MKKENIIEEQLKPLDGYLISITRNTLEGWYELKIGVPVGWVYKGNEYIGCDIVNETENGVLLKIYPKSDDIFIDDLLFFARLILDTNSKIAAKEQEFKSKMDEVKKQLQNQAQEFYQQLENLKTDSFKKFSDDSDMSNSSDESKNQVVKKPRSRTTTKTPRKNNVKPVKDTEEDTVKTIPQKVEKTEDKI